jgi:hypothetical protein
VRPVRTFVAAVLVALGCIVLLLASIAVWVNRTVVSTEGWVDTVGPLSQEEAVAVAGSEALTFQIADSVDLEGFAEERLPERAQPLAAPLAGAVRNFVQNQVHDVILSDQFNTLWVEANERAHSLFVRFMDDEISAADRAEGVVLDLRNAVEEADARLEERGIDLFEGEVPEDVGQVHLFGEGRLETVRTGWDLLKALDWVLVAVALVLLAAALLISRRRRRTGIQIGVGIVLTMAVFAIGVRFARNLLFEDIQREEIRAAADAVWDNVRAGLLQQTIVLFVLGLLMAVGLWISGPGRQAVRLRAFASRQLASLRSGRLDEGRAAGLGAFLRDHRRAVEGGALTLTILVLLLLPRLSAVTLIVATIVFVIFVGVVEFLVGPPIRQKEV